MKNPTVALDIGMVCIELEFERCRRAFGFPENTMIPPAILIANAKLECGKASVEDFLSAMRKATGNKLSDRDILDKWNLILGNTRPGMRDRIGTLAKRGVRFVFFSDISIIHATEFFRKSDLCHFVRDAVFSFEAGAQKPGSAMYERFESLHGVPDYYFDDKLCNIEAAEKRGWNAIQFFKSEQLELIR